MIPIILPCIAVILPIIVLVRSQTRPIRNSFLYSIASFACSLAAICAEVFNIRERMAAGDVGGVEDIIGAVFVICIIVSVISVAANLIALAAVYGEEPQERAKNLKSS